MLDSIARLVEAAKQTAAASLPRSLEDLTPLPALEAGHAALTGAVQGRERIVAGIGGLLGIAGVGSLAYHRWQAGELNFGQEGVLALPSFEPRGHPRRPLSKIKPEYRPLDLRSQIILNAPDFEGLSGLFHSDLVNRARAGGFLQVIGQDLLSSESHGAHLGQYQTPQAAALADAKWELAKVDAMHRQGLLSGDLKTAYEDLLNRPANLFDEAGGPTAQAQALREFIGTLSRLTADIEDPAMRLPPDRTWRAVEMGPQGPRFAVTYREQVLPVRAEPTEVLRRMDHLDYEAAIPDMVSNLLHIKGYYATPGEIAKGMRWYSEAHDLAQDLRQRAKAQGKDLTIQQAAGIISAFSPQLKWDVNVDVAIKFVESGGTLESHPRGVVRRSFANARRIWGGEPIEKVLVSEKTSNFARNIADPFERSSVTVDRHSVEAALAFRTWTDGGKVFDATPNGRAAYQAVAEAHRITARIEGLIANQVQAIDWLPVQAMKGPGVRLGFEFGARLREMLLGQGENGIAAVAARAQGDDVGAVAHLPAKHARGDTTRPSFVEVLEPGGTSTVIGEGSSTLLSEAFRTLHPLGGGTDGDLGWVRWVPVEHRVVADTEAVVNGVVTQLVDRRKPAGGGLERHTTTDHPGMIPGNRVVVQVPQTDAQRLAGLKAELTQRGVPATVSDLAAHDRFLPELKAHRLGPDDVASWKRKDLLTELPQRQWVGISGWRTGASQEANDAANAALRSALEKRGYRPVEVDGYYDGHEKSFIVFGMPNSEAVELGRRFKQESVVSPLGLLYTTGPNRGSYNPSTGELTVPGQKETNYYSEMTVGGGRKVRFQQGLDFDRLEPFPADLDASTRPNAQPSVGVVVDLGEKVNPALLDEVWGLVQEQGFDAVAYSHGVAPKGAGRVAEHHFSDSAGRSVVYRSLARNLDDPNATWAYVPARDAASFTAEPLPAVHGAEKHVAVEMGDGRFGDALYDGELRLLYNHLGDDVVISTKNPLQAVVAGRPAGRWAMWVPAGDLPVLAYGADGVEQLSTRFGADPSRIVMGSKRGGQVTLRGPGALGDEGRVNEVMAARARQALVRAGVPAGSIRVHSAPWEAAKPAAAAVAPPT